MGIMTATDVIIREGPFTLAERDALPEDGYRHELLDGMLVMSPSPGARHQDLGFGLAIKLRSAAPSWAKVMIAPFDVVIGPRTVIVPDILVARREDVTAKDLPTAPLLAVEVLSPSTRSIDLGRKRELLAGAGCPSYWVVDPKGPTLTVFELDGDVYVERARVEAHESWTATAPYAVTLRPRDLLDE